MKTPSATPGIHPLAAYIPGPFERFGRRIKVEYLGMASVYSIIALYWKRLVSPHRWNTLLFACLAPWDGRLAALFGMVAVRYCCARLYSGTAWIRLL